MRPTVSVVGICIVPGRINATLRMRLPGVMMVHVFEAEITLGSGYIPAYPLRNSTTN